MLLRFLRQDKRHAAIRPAQQLAVEQIGGNRLCHQDPAGGNHQRRKTRHPLRQLLEKRGLVGKGLLMAEQDLTVAHRDDVVMKNPVSIAAGCWRAKISWRGLT